MSDPAGPGPALSRRGLLAAAAAGGLVSACDLHAPTLTHVRHSDPADTRAVADALDATERMLVQISARTAAHPALTHRLAGVVAMHRAHLAVLRRGEKTPSGHATSFGLIDRGKRTALHELEQQEHALRARLSGLALGAHDGELARLFASMAAAISQRLAEWPQVARR